MKIFFSSNAKSDLSEIVHYISEDNPQAAREWTNSIFESVKKLSCFPKLGRIVPEYFEDSIREIIKGQYRIVYKISQVDKNICIIAIHHSKRPLV